MKVKQKSNEPYSRKKLKDILNKIVISEVKLDEKDIATCHIGV